MKTSTKNSSTNCDSTRHVTDAQHDGVRTTVKKGTPKILSKSISRTPMGSLVGH